MTLTKYNKDGAGTITSDTFGSSKYIQYKPLDFTQPEPAPPSTRVDTSSTYYVIQKYEWVGWHDKWYIWFTNSRYNRFISNS